MPAGLTPPPPAAQAGAETERSEGSWLGALGRSVALPAAVGVVIGLVFVAVSLGASAAPVPRELPIAVVGDPSAAAQVQAGLDAQAPGQFLVQQVPDAAAAAGAVRSGRALAGLTTGPEPQLVVAGAHGRTLTTAVTGAVTGLLGAPPPTEDVAPLAPGDTAGQVIGLLAFGVVLGGFLFGITSFQSAPRLVLRWRLVSVALFAVLTGLLAAWLATGVLDALPAPFWPTAGLVSLLALATAAGAALLLRVLGSAGSWVASVLLLVVGNAAIGGTTPVQYLPEWLRVLAGVLPEGVAVRALRGLAYLQDDGVVRGVVVLLLGVALPVALLAAVDAVLRARQRRTPA